MTDDLLKPELSAQADHRQIFSVQAGFFVAFLGGPVAIACFSGINSYRLGRLARDLPVYLLAACAALALLYIFVTQPGLFGDGETSEVARTYRLVNRGLALLSFGIFYLMHRTNYRTAALVGEPPSPWSAGIACVLFGIGLSIVATGVLSTFSGGSAA